MNISQLKSFVEEMTADAQALSEKARRFKELAQKIEVILNAEGAIIEIRDAYNHIPPKVSDAAGIALMALVMSMGQKYPEPRMYPYGMDYPYEHPGHLIAETSKHGFSINDGELHSHELICSFCPG